MDNWKTIFTQFNNIVSRLLQSIQILTKMIKEEQKIENNYEAKDEVTQDGKIKTNMSKFSQIVAGCL